MNSTLHISNYDCFCSLKHPVSFKNYLGISYGWEGDHLANSIYASSEHWESRNLDPKVKRVYECVISYLKVIFLFNATNKAEICSKDGGK